MFVSMRRPRRAGRNMCSHCWQVVVLKIIGHEKLCEIPKKVAFLGEGIKIKATDGSRSNETFDTHTVMSVVPLTLFAIILASECLPKLGLDKLCSRVSPQSQIQAWVADSLVCRFQLCSTPRLDRSMDYAERSRL